MATPIGITMNPVAWILSRHWEGILVGVGPRWDSRSSRAREGNLGSAQSGGGIEKERVVNLWQNGLYIVKALYSISSMTGIGL